MNDFKMAMTVPSRGDSVALKTFFTALDDTKYSGDVILGFDNDDPELENLIDVAVDAQNLDFHSEFVIGERKRFVGTLNDLSRQYLDKYDSMSMHGVDHLPRTKHFDKMVIDSLQNNVLCWGPDGIQNENMCSCAFVRTDAIRAVGYFVLPTLTHLYVEQYFSSVFGPEGINSMKYVPGMFIQHMHPCAGLAEWNEQYAELNSNEMYTKDRNALEQFIVSGDRDAVVERLKEKGFGF